MSKISADLNVMMKAAELAARSLNRDFGEVEKLQVSKKGPGDFVSAADRRAEKIIYEELLKARPDYSFLMEESGAKAGKDKENRWIIDPLDGTSNFLHGLPHWAISIALERKGEVVAGIVYDPIKDEMFRAERHEGAFIGRKRLRVSARQDPMEAMIAIGAPRTSAKKERFLKEYHAVLNYAPGLRRFGSASLDLAYVAAGRYEAFWERNLSSWDVAAGILIVKEAGGFVSDLDKDTANPVNTGNIIASNDSFFVPLKKIIRSA
ncbi:inositol monophosphatase [Alphaproteobacteria bacterium]|nr:inositol monophosphatase [Alphaproteobacteria bacterium]